MKFCHYSRDCFDHREDSVATVGGLMVRAEKGLTVVASLLLSSIMCPEKLLSKETCRSQMIHCMRQGEVSPRG